MRIMKKNLYLLITLMLVLSGCIFFKPAARELIPSETPKKFSLYSESKIQQNSLWWKDFNSPELDRLVEKALGVNFDLRQAYARLNQSRALLKKSKASLFPELSASAGFSNTKTETESGGLTVSTNSKNYSAGLAASYELDLWGRIRSKNEADLLYMKESQALYDTAAMTVSAGVADMWIDIIATRQEIVYIKAGIKTNENLLKMMELRFEKSLASALDVLQQREGLASAKSRLPSLEAKEKVLMNNLILLVGKSSGADIKVSNDSLPDMPPVPDSGLPADLISNRPDIRAAGLRLKAADWEISAAQAARLPVLSLSASGVYSASTMDDVFRNWAANLAANLTGPIFDAGRRKAEVNRVKAVAEERLAIYEKTVFSAVCDVENALVNEDRQIVYLKALENERKASELSLGETNRRYLAGQVTFLTLQEKLLRFQVFEGQLIRQKAVLLKYRISLYRALGGNWSKLTDQSGNKVTFLRQGTEQ